MIDGSRPIKTPIYFYSKPSASPRETSSRSGNVSIMRTAGILSHRTTKIKCYDRLNPPGSLILALLCFPIGNTLRPMSAINRQAEPGHPHPMFPIGKQSKAPRTPSGCRGDFCLAIPQSIRNTPPEW